MELDNVKVDEMIKVMEEVFMPDIIELKDHAGQAIYHAGQAINCGCRIVRNAATALDTLTNPNSNEDENQKVQHNSP